MRKIIISSFVVHLALIEFPTHIDFGSIPTNYVNCKNLLLKNCCNKPTYWSLSHSFVTDESESDTTDFENADPNISYPKSTQQTDRLLFKPSKGMLRSNESCYVSCEYTPLTVGIKHLAIALKHDEGVFDSNITATATNVLIELSDSELKFPSAYINLNSQSVFTMHNRSNMPFKFCILPQTAEEKIDATQMDSLAIQTAHDFSHENWDVFPCKGEIFPNGFKKFVVTFSPKESKTYSQTALIHCQGRESPIPIKWHGCGIGPKAAFSFDILDVGKVFIHAIHEYTVQLHNIGDIAGVFAMRCNNSDEVKFGFKHTS